jgi:hypothetical protein
LWCTGNHIIVMEFFYDFNSNQVVNPLDRITHFFVNPYMIGSWKMLGLDKKVSDCEVVIQESTGLPIIILPISLLNLEKVHVKMENNGNMLITNRLSKVTQKIYAKPTEQKHIVRIDTVLNSSHWESLIA